MERLLLILAIAGAPAPLVGQACPAPDSVLAVWRHVPPYSTRRVLGGLAQVLAKTEELTVAYASGGDGRLVPDTGVRVHATLAILKRLHGASTDTIEVAGWRSISDSLMPLTVPEVVLFYSLEYPFLAEGATSPRRDWWAWPACTTPPTGVEAQRLARLLEALPVSAQ